jgi:hypothetical protein
MEGEPTINFISEKVSFQALLLISEKVSFQTPSDTVKFFMKSEFSGTITYF